MAVPVEFHFDFGSPNAYFSHKVIPEIEKRSGVRFSYVPILLGGVFKLTNNSAPMLQFKDVTGKLAYMSDETRRFMRDHHLTKFKMNPYFPVNTVQVMRGAIVASQEGFLEKYADAVFALMWEQGLKMDDADVMRRSLTDAGMDGDHIMEKIQDPAVKEALAKNTSASVERGNFGAPTFYVGDEMFFGKDRLEAVEREIALAG